ncbi:MAG: SDR family oxidoreductase, partial [Nocardioidaceae bacterium]
MRLSERLADRRVLLTGVTGFVGEALLHRLLAEFPRTRIVALARPKGSLTARARMEQVLRKPVFESVRTQYGENGEQAEPAAILDDRIEVLEGDLVDLPPLPSDVDVVVHCAGDVSFDPPIHEAFETNVFGSQRLLAALREAGASPHYVQISTAYVAGRRRGAIIEGPVDHDVDWRDEARWGQA